MNIVKLERAIAVYEAGSFRKAAKRNGMSQPALTWSVRQLEESIGVALFERGPSGIRPTEACESLIVRARLIVNEQNRLLAEVARKNKTQTIVVGVHALLLNSQFAKTIAMFRDKQPNVNLRVVEAYSADLLQQLRRGDLDLALSAAPPTSEDTESISFEPLLRQQYAVFAGPDHPVIELLNAGGPIPDQDWVRTDAPNAPIKCENPDLVFKVLARYGMTQHSATVQSLSMQFIRRMVMDGGMLAMVPASQFAREIREGTVKQLPGSTIEGPTLGILQLENCYESLAMRRLKSVLRMLECPFPFDK